jgi:hypothetical protein
VYCLWNACLSSVSILLSEERVRKGAEKLMKFLNAKQQGRLDGFFTVKAKSSPGKSNETTGKGPGKDDTKGKKRKVMGVTPVVFMLLLNGDLSLGVRREEGRK